MHIQDAFHPDGISNESGDEFDETDSGSRSPQEKLDGNQSSSPSPVQDQHGNYSLKIC
jgi:hypothetical protein